MLLTDEHVLDKAQGFTLSPELAMENINGEFDLNRLLDFAEFEDYSDEGLDEPWTQKINDGWYCVASDYNVQYKKMNEHFHPLHENNIAVDLQRLKTVGDYKLVDITRATYEVHDGKYIRVSVHAKLVFEQLG